MLKSNEIKKEIVKYIYGIVTLVIAFSSSAFLWYCNVSHGWSEGYKGYLTLSCVGALFCIIYSFFAKMYGAQKIGLYRLTELVYFNFLAFIIADVALYVESVFWFHGFEKLNIISYFVVFGLQILSVTIVIFVCNRFFAKYDEPRKIMVVYGTEEYTDFINKVNKKKLRYEVVGCFDENTDKEIIENTIDECQSVYLYGVNQNKKKELILYCKSKGIDVYVTQKIEDVILRGFDVSHTFDIPFVRTKKTPEKWYYSIVKRIADITISGVALIVLIPVFLVVSLAIKAYDGGPVFYTQTRLTKGHREFQIYKFRSMIINAEKKGARLSSQNDDRITPVGKIIRMTRIDELPQLINILKGDMSLIGPRPERPEIEKKYLEELPEFSLRLEVPAGLSGYAQVFGKYNTTPLNKLKLDLLYINQRSLLLDFKLLFYTIKILFIPESTEGVETVTTYTNEEAGDKGESEECAKKNQP